MSYTAIRELIIVAMIGLTFCVVVGCISIEAYEGSQVTVQAEINAAGSGNELETDIEKKINQEDEDEDENITD